MSITQTKHILAFCGCYAGRTWEFHSCPLSHFAPHSFRIHWSSTRIPVSCFRLRLHSPHHHKSFHLSAQTKVKLVKSELAELPFHLWSRGRLSALLRNKADVAEDTSCQSLLREDSDGYLRTLCMCFWHVTTALAPQGPSMTPARNRTI